MYQRARQPPAEQAITQKLQKALAQAGHGSRREIEGWIRAGRVTVNGVAAHVGARVGPNDSIQVDGRLVGGGGELRAARVLVYHKPEGEIVSRDDPEGRAKRVRPAPIGERRQVARGRAPRLQYRRLAGVDHIGGARQPDDASALCAGTGIRRADPRARVAGRHGAARPRHRARGRTGQAGIDTGAGRRGRQPVVPYRGARRPQPDRATGVRGAGHYRQPADAHALRAGGAATAPDARPFRGARAGRSAAIIRSSWHGASPRSIQSAARQGRPQPRRRPPRNKRYQSHRRKRAR